MTADAQRAPSAERDVTIALVDGLIDRFRRTNPTEAYFELTLEQRDLIISALWTHRCAL